MSHVVFMSHMSRVTNATATATDPPPADFPTKAKTEFVSLGKKPIFSTKKITKKIKLSSNTKTMFQVLQFQRYSLRPDVSSPCGSGSHRSKQKTYGHCNL